MSVESADPETTSLIKRVDAPLPPYAAQAGADPSAPLPAPLPPPHGNDVVPGPLSSTSLAPSETGTGALPTVVPAPTSAAIEVVTCPSCGTTAEVTLNRRESVDFCRNCDYPLFWTPSKIFRDPAEMGDDSLRRLPGTVGRATLAALPCPHCSEPNALSAETCVRCGLSMHVVVEQAPPPPPPQVVEAPPPAPEPVKKVAWWVWAMLVLGAVALITLIVLITTHTID